MSKETILSIDTSDGKLNGVPLLQFYVAKQGLYCLSRGLKLTRMATPKRCMDIISRITGFKYKRTDRARAHRDAEMIQHALHERARALREEERRMQTA